MNKYFPVKDRIVETALEQFLKHGIRSMTIKKLIEPMGISTKTVYKYFESKEDLLAECLRLLYGSYHNEFVAILSIDQSPVNHLLLVYRAAMVKDFGVNQEFFHDLNYYYPELQNAAIQHYIKNYPPLMLSLVQKGIAEGYFHSFLIAEVALKGISTLYTSITRPQDKKRQDNPYELFKNLVEVYIRGMCTEKGLKEIKSNPYHNE
jgi:AcrR family transcriptional regulator